MTGDCQDPDPEEVDEAGAFYEKYESRAYFYAFSMLGDHHDAEDCVSDSFLTMTRYWQRVRYAPGSTRAYVFTVLRNLIKRRLKAQSKKPEALWDPTDPESIASFETVVGDFAQQIVDNVTVTSALNKLPEEQREAVVLFHAFDKSIADIAMVMGDINKNTTKDRVARGRERLSRILTKRANTREEDPR